MSALLPDCFSGAKLQSSLDLGGQSWVGRHARPSLVFSNTSCSVASFLLLANMPGNVIHKVELLSIFIPFLLNHHFVFLFFCLALKKNNITKFPNVHSRVRISSSTPVVEDTQSWQASLFT